MVDFNKLLEKEFPKPRRKRSEASLTGLFCSECLKEGKAEPQYKTESGDVCRFGHGGVEGVAKCDHEMLATAQNPCLHCAAEKDQTEHDEDHGGTPHDDLPADHEVPLFEDSDGRPEGFQEPKLHRGFACIIESMHVLDPEAEYKRLRDALKLGDAARNDKGKLREALDNAEDNARAAHLLYCAAVIEADRYDIDATPVFGKMWGDAVEQLEKHEHLEDEEEETSGKRKRAKARKNITNEDVRAKAAAMYPDQWRRHHIGVKKVKLMVEHVKELADQWQSRCKSLNTLLGTAR